MMDALLMDSPISVQTKLVSLVVAAMYLVLEMVLDCSVPQPPANNNYIRALLCNLV